MKIGIFGGSFNPVHLEHVEIVRAAIKSLGLDLIYVVAAKIPPHKTGIELCAAEDRLNMLQLAFSGIDKVEVFDIEIKREGVSYTYITVEDIKKRHCDAEIYLLIGTDMLADFPTWKNPVSILNNCTLFVTPREGEDNDSAIIEFEKIFNKSVFISSYEGGKISSTKARVFLKLGLSTDKLLDRKVRDYIEKNKLFVGDKLYNYVASKLPEKRLRHTANVIVLAKSYAKRLNIDITKVETAALLHDIAKYEKSENYKDFVLPRGTTKAVEHQFLGAYIAEKILKIDDKEILEAIKYHSTGKINMSVFDKVIFLADLLEEGRAYPGVDEIRSRVDQNFEQGFIYSLNMLWEYLESQSDEVCEITKHCRDYYNNINKQ